MAAVKTIFQTIERPEIYVRCASNAGLKVTMHVTMYNSLGLGGGRKGPDPKHQNYFACKAQSKIKFSKMESLKMFPGWRNAIPEHLLLRERGAKIMPLPV